MFDCLEPRLDRIKIQPAPRGAGIKGGGGDHTDHVIGFCFRIGQVYRYR